MPEIKSTFNQGKMNQDLDERLIPKGQYREALNIQVSTSEESDVGTAQNVPGNILINAYAAGNPVVGGNWDCVGAIADEKNDALYWFIHNSGGRDAIIEYKDGIVTPVLVALEKSAPIEVINTTRWLYDFTVSAGNKTAGVGTTNLYLSDIGSKKNPKVKIGDKLIEFETTSGSLYNPSNRFVTAVNYTTKIVTISNSIYNGGGTSVTGNLVKFRDMQTYQPNRSVLGFTGDLITGINIISGDDSAGEDKLLLWTDDVNEPRKINIQRCIDGTSALDVHTNLIVDRNNFTKRTNLYWRQSFSGNGTTVINLGNVGSTNKPLVKKEDQLVEYETTSATTIYYPQSFYVTNVNYATGDVTIENRGTGNPGLYNGGGSAIIGTRVMFEGNIKIAEEHINVIKKNPKKAPTIKLEANNRPGNTRGETNDTDGGTQFVGGDGTNTYTKRPGDIVDIYISQTSTPVYLGMGVEGNVPTGNQPDALTATNWKVGDVLLAQKIQPTPTAIPLQFNYMARVKVLSKSNTYEIDNTGEYEQYFETEIIEILPGIAANLDLTNVALFEVALQDEEVGIFETKIPRFAYRYKYEDNEYSAFSPFSEPAFLPSGFSYHPTKNPYNLGMVNYARTITIQDFIPADIPLDVVQVDLLYKEEGSTNVYSVDSVKPNDRANSGSNYNPWNSIGSTPVNFYNQQITTDKGSYEITSDNVRGVIPSNQMLRPWDNVPRKAKSQEVTSSRIVYGNYLQNYDLLNKPIVKAGFRRRSITSNDFIDTSIAQKSIKSFRDYQVGVVYGDKYGRETPVFTEDDASFKVPFNESVHSNQIYASLYGSQPEWADYYKIYVKETSGEYYNLVMDRVYRAEDEDNLWISFPSSDRNKITEESFMSLKKQIDVNVAVSDKNKFKIIDIKNEAPDFIKSKYVRIVEIDSNSLQSTNLVNTAASVNTTEISFDSNFFNSSFTSLVDSDGRKLNEEPLSVVFFKANPTGVPDLASERYKITAYSDSKSGSLILTLDKGINEETDGWIASTSGYEDGVTLKIFKEEKIDKQEFQGRFFVKIVQDEITDKFIEGQILRQSLERVSGAVDAYYLADEHGTFNEVSGVNTADYQNTHLVPSSTNDTTWRSETFADWEKNFKFGTTSAQKSWFIDQTHFRSNQSLGSLDPSSSKNQGRRYYRGIHRITNPNYTNGGSNAFADEPNFYKLGRTYMELSFGSVGEDLHDLGPNQTGKSSGELDYGSVRNIQNQFSDSFDKVKHSNQWNTNSTIEKKLAIGTKFKFKKVDGTFDETMYEITNVLIRRNYNYQSWAATKTQIDAYLNGSQYFNIGYSAQEGEDALESLGEFGKKENRRVTYICEIKGLSGNGSDPTNDDLTTYDPINTDNSAAKNDVAIGLQFTTTFIDEEDEATSVNPAVWETEAEDLTDLNIYYEASQAYPLSIDSDDTDRSVLLAPIGSRVWCSNGQYNRTSPAKNFDDTQPNYFNPTNWEDPVIIKWDGDEVEIWPGVDVDINYTIDKQGQTDAYQNKVFRFYRPDNSFTSARIVEVTALNLDTSGTMSSDKVRRFKVKTQLTSGLPWSNCFSFSNGVESNRIRDDFNRPTISNGVRASSTIEEPYAEERRGTGLIYSGIYNSTSGVNSLNQFIQAEKITKDLNPTYGTIQKLFQRRISLIAFCEDRVVGVMSGKDTLFNADGNAQLVSTNRVLGDAKPFVGDYGISKDPGSFAKESYRVYFTDRQRGAVLRLSMDGLTPISDAGMSDYFKDNLKPAYKLIGSHDDRKKEYNLTIDRGVQTYPTSETISFKENAGGWVSFKSFIPDCGVSMSGDYYTFFEGKLHKHNEETLQPRNAFYGQPLQGSFIKTVLNNSPSDMKNFHTINYEGDAGWSASISTPLQSGTINEFMEKEGKFFGYISGESDIIDVAAFNFQGIGNVITVDTI